MIKYVFLLFTVALSLLSAPLPTLNGHNPGTQMIGEAFSSKVCFNNQTTVSTDTGYQPGLEIVTPQGVQLTGINFATLPVNTQQIGTCLNTDNPPCSYINPDTDNNRTNVDENETFYIVKLPLGSFTSDMPEQCFTLNFVLGSSSEVTLGMAEHIRVQPNFILGSDALDNPQVDPAIYGTEIPLEVIPNVFEVKKEIVAQESESATGENFPHNVALSVNVANGETINNLIIKDILPPEMKFISLISNGGCTLNSQPDFVTTQELKLTCASITGTTASEEVKILYNFYLPEKDAMGLDVINPVTGAHNLITNYVSATTTYPVLGLTLSDDANDSIVAKPITIYKPTPSIVTDRGTPGFSSFDELEYSLKISLSDYFKLDKIKIKDALTDGLMYLSLKGTTYTLELDGVTTTHNIDVGNIAETAPDTNGDTTVLFNISNQLREDGLSADGSLSGDDKNNGVHNGSPTMLTIKYHVLILKNYRVAKNATTTIKASDTLSNSVILDSTLESGNTAPNDDSSSEISIPHGSYSKSIYAINGNTSISAPYLIHPGDVVTFRLRGDLAPAVFHDLRITDYLPMPFFNVSEGGTWPQQTGGGAGTWEFGPDHDLLDIPVRRPITKNTTQNMLEWDYAPGDDFNVSGVIDILFHITASSEPMSDSLTLTNVSYGGYNNSQLEQFGESGYIQIITQEPELSIVKKITATTNANSTLENDLDKPYNSLLHNATGGDTISFEVNVTNFGNNTAYDVIIQDRFEQGGIANQGLTACSIPNIIGGNGHTGDLINSDLNVSSLDINKSVIITYTCDVDPTFSPGKDIINKAQLLHYASLPNGVNFVNKEIASSTKIDLVGVIGIEKDILSTSLATTNANSVNTGELIDFNMSLKLSAGTYKNFSIDDPLCSAFVYDLNDSLSVVGSDLIATANPSTLKFHCSNYIATTSGKNTVTFRADNIEDISADVAWSVLEPPVTTSKTMNPAKADAGDTITGNFTWNVEYNTDNTKHPVYNCKIEDNLSTAVDFTGNVIYDFASFNLVTTPAGYSCGFNSVTGIITCNTTNNTTVCPNGSVEFTIETSADAVVGSSYPNTIKFDGKSLPENHYSGSDTTQADVKEESTAAFALNSPSKPIKSIIHTSETHTSDVRLNSKPPVAVGEVITYEIEYKFSEGITKEVELFDELLDEGWAEYVPNSFYIRKRSASLTGTSSAAAIINAAPIDTNTSIADAELQFTPSATTPTRVSINMGDVQNSNVTAGSTKQSYIIGLKFKVKNSASNLAGYDKSNNAKIRFRQGSGAKKSLKSELVSVEIVEPIIEVDKTTENGLTFEAGDIVEYKINICNDKEQNIAYSTTGFEWKFTDILDDKLSSSDASLAVTTHGIGINVNASFIDGQHLVGSINKLDRGECVTIGYDATIAADASYGESLSNSVEARTTSLVGDFGEVGVLSGLNDQDPGLENGERTGSGGINYLNKNSDYTVFIDKAGIAKTLKGYKHYYPIEDIATYVLAIGVPKGGVDNFIVEDHLPVGLSLVGTPIVNTSVGVPAYTFTNTNGLLQWDFGSFITSNEVIGYIEYNVSVENILSNQDGIILKNSASLRYDDPNNASEHITTGPISSVKDVVVGEPNLFMAKHLTSSVSKNIQAGDRVSYSIVIKNEGNTQAFDVNWSDTLPQSLANISTINMKLKGLAAHRYDTNATLTNSDISTFTTDYSDGFSTNNSLKVVPFNLPVNSEIEITFDATIQNNLISGSDLTNTTRANYRSIYVNGRDGSDGGNDDDDTLLNNYNEKAHVTFVSNAEIQLTKALALQKDKYTIGEEVRYVIRIDIPQANLNSASLIDKLPLGLTYQSHSITVGNGGITYDTSANTPSICSVGTACEVNIDFGNISNPDNGNHSDDYIDVEIVTKVDNTMSNQNNVTLLNGESSDGISGSPVYFDYANSNGATYFDLDSVQVGYQGIPIQIVEPNLHVSKTVSPTPQTINDIITYHVSVEHTPESKSDAFDLNFTDRLPFGIDFIPGSEEGIKLTQNGRTLFANANVFPKSSGVYHFSYKAKIEAGINPNIEHFNTIELKYASLPSATGASDNARNGIDGGTGLNDYIAKAKVGVLAGASNKIIVTKSADRAFVTTSDGSVVYTINIENNGTLDVNITSIIDDKFGDVTAISGSTCSVQQFLPIGNSYSCTFPATIVGIPGDIHINEVNASSIDRAGNISFATDTAKVRLLDAGDSAIGQRVFFDENGNGILDRNEKGIDAVTLNLVDNNSGLVIASTITNEDGFYLFDGLSAGSYDVVVSDTSLLLSNYMLTTNNEPYTATIGASTQDLNANFGYTEPKLEVRKSSNITAVQAPKGDVTYFVDITNIGGNTITLTSITDTVFDPLVAPSTCITNQKLFRGDSYHCEFTRTISGNEGESHDNTISVKGVDAQNNVAEAKDDHHIIFVDGVNAYAGLLVFYDSNGNGFYDAGEPGLDSVNMELLDSNMNVIDTDISSRYLANSTAGLYLFDGLPAGDYFIQTNGGTPTWRAVNPNGGYVLTSGQNPLPFTITAGQIYLQANFGFALSSIEVFKYANSISVNEPGGIVQFSAVIKNTGGVSVILDTLTDDVFGDLDAKGTCTLPQTIGVGASYSCSFNGLVSGKSGDVHTDTITATAHDVDNNIRTDSASRNIAITDGTIIVGGNTIGDRVFVDSNKNGVQDIDEVGIAGVSVDLYDSSNTLIGTKITDSDGVYIFDQLALDTYKVVVTDTDNMLKGYIITTPAEYTITINKNNQIVLTADFGYNNEAHAGPLSNTAKALLILLFALSAYYAIRKKQYRHM